MHSSVIKSFLLLYQKRTPNVFGGDKHKKLFKQKAGVLPAFLTMPALLIVFHNEL